MTGTLEATDTCLMTQTVQNYISLRLTKDITTVDDSSHLGAHAVNGSHIVRVGNGSIARLNAPPA